MAVQDTLLLLSIFRFKENSMSQGYTTATIGVGITIGGAGEGSIIGQGGAVTGGGTRRSAATNSGGGGSGAGATGNGSAFAGGNGAANIIIVWEFS